MTIPDSFPDLFEIGEHALERFKKEFQSYGIETDPDVTLRRGTGLLCYYDFNDRQIYLSMPDLRASTGKLQLLMLRQMMGAENNENLMRFLAVFIPFVIAHEMTHHFRHRYGLFSEDSWYEEQLANRLAAAVNKNRLSPEEKAFTTSFLENSMKKLGEQIGLAYDAVDSYFDIAHALHSSEQIGDEEMSNFRMVQGMVSETSSSTMILRRSGNLSGDLQERLKKRRDLISHFNEQYASDAARYIYYQVGWVYLAMKSQDTSYVDEFACRHLAMAPKLLEIRLPEEFKPRYVYACFKASQEFKQTHPSLGRYFYKRYRALLLNYLRKSHREVLRNVEGVGDLNFDFLSIWNDRFNDSLNFMINMVTPFAREIFPSRIAQSPALVNINLPDDLPTEEDRQMYLASSHEMAEAVQNTLEIISLLDGLELFRSLPIEAYPDVAKKLYKVKYAEGENLVWQGETNNDVFILLDGQLEVLVPERGITSAIQPGEVFGEIAWLTKGTRVATVRARTPSTCLVVKENDLRLLCYQNPGILMTIAERTAQRYSQLQSP
ncbi:MAG: cyclic nucleotide-binding domain-containing protein [Chloroflexi bacterium]|nr:cyclic nucleotide-binding domain-containing protein [Chloroflexota bacterium]